MANIVAEPDHHHGRGPTPTAATRIWQDTPAYGPDPVIKKPSTAVRRAHMSPDPGTHGGRSCQEGVVI